MHLNILNSFGSSLGLQYIFRMLMKQFCFMIENLLKIYLISFNMLTFVLGLNLPQTCFYFFDLLPNFDKYNEICILFLIIVPHSMNMIYIK